jgi:hypothetical protein
LSFAEGSSPEASAVFSAAEMNDTFKKNLRSCAPSPPHQYLCPMIAVGVIYIIIADCKWTSLLMVFNNTGIINNGSAKASSNFEPHGNRGFSFRKICNGPNAFFTKKLEQQRCQKTLYT